MEFGQDLCDGQHARQSKVHQRSGKTVTVYYLKQCSWIGCADQICFGLAV
jgi:hypothetical protein